MDAQRRPVEEYECGSPTKSSPTPLYDPLSNSQSSNLAAPKAPPAKDNVLKSYQVRLREDYCLALKLLLRYLLLKLGFVTAKVLPLTQSFF